MAPYQQSFRIDDLLTRKTSEQQPGHFCPSLHPPPPGSNLHPPPPGSNLHSPPPGLPGLEQMDKPVANLTCQANGKVIIVIKKVNNSEQSPWLATVQPLNNGHAWDPAFCPL